MLAVAMLVAGLFGVPRPVHTEAANATCPAGPVATFTTTARTCPALELSGRADGAEPSLDPAFDVSVPPADLARSGDGDALLTGYAADGHRLFSLPMQARGAFHLYVPLATNAQEALARVTLAVGTATAERVSSNAAEQGAEIIALDDDRVIVTWNAFADPAIRIAEAPGRPPVGSGNGTGTYEQVTVDTKARRLYLEFSDGVRSFTRAYAIFGRS